MLSTRLGFILLMLVSFPALLLPMVPWLLLSVYFLESLKAKVMPVHLSKRRPMRLHCLNKCSRLFSFEEAFARENTLSYSNSSIRIVLKVSDHLHNFDPNTLMVDSKFMSHVPSQTRHYQPKAFSGSLIKL
jgi:hypothetical protein